LVDIVVVVETGIGVVGTEVGDFLVAVGVEPL
jgi:hypothetical protein